MNYLNYREKVNQKLKRILMQYFDIGDSDYYICMRDKSAFSAGTMTLDDFMEFDEDVINDLLDYIEEKYEQEEL